MQNPPLQLGCLAATTRIGGPEPWQFKAADSQGNCEPPTSYPITRNIEIIDTVVASLWSRLPERKMKRQLCSYIFICIKHTHIYIYVYIMKCILYYYIYIHHICISWKCKYIGLFTWLSCIYSYTHLLFCLFIHSLIYLFISLSFIDLFISLFTCVFIYLFIRLYVHVCYMV